MWEIKYNYYSLHACSTIHKVKQIEKRWNTKGMNSKIFVKSIS